MARIRHHVSARGCGAIPDAFRHQYFCPALAHCVNHRCIQHYWRADQATAGQDPRHMGAASGYHPHALLLGDGLCHDGSVRECGNICRGPGLFGRGVSDVVFVSDGPPPTPYIHIYCQDVRTSIDGA